MRDPDAVGTSLPPLPDGSPWLDLPLEELEKHVDPKAKGFARAAETGNALRGISQTKAYKQTPERNWDPYLVARWNMRRSQAHRLMGFAWLDEVLSPMGDEKPRNEGQVRQLIVLLRADEAAALAVWRELVATYGTAVGPKDVNSAVRARMRRIGAASPRAIRRILSRDFGAPPFTVLNANAAYWQTRKDDWLDVPLRGWVGRPGGLAYNIGDDDTTSVFDPVLTELSYAWFCPPGGPILDPFAGGPTRGIVAAALGYRYVGVDIRSEQVEANEQEAVAFQEAIWSAENTTLLPDRWAEPTWLHGDSRDLDRVLPVGDMFDMLFTCPPYYDLERYDGGPGDLSMAPTYGDFLGLLRDSMGGAVRRLRDGAFAALVIGEVRDAKTGDLRPLVADTTSLLRDLGLTFYNSAVHVWPASTLAVRAARQFMNEDPGAKRPLGTRKLGNGHDFLLVFYKGHLPERWWKVEVREN